MAPQATIAVTDSPATDIVREYGYLPMRDGVRLAYVLYRRGGPVAYPAIVCYSIYAQSAAAYEEAQGFLDAGYAYLGVNVRGSGASGGEYSYYQPIEADDGFEVVEWVAAQPWCDGNVGMVGASYGGHTQIKVAALRPPHLRAIVPIAVEGSEYRDEAMAGGLFNAGLMAEWTFRTQPETACAGVLARVAAGDPFCAGSAVAGPRNRAYAEVLEHPLIDDWWRARSLDEVVAQVTVPVLLIHAWQDEWIRPNGAIRLFNALKTADRRLILQNGPHRIGRREVNVDEQMRWLERWVKGRENGVESGPKVTVLWEMSKSAENAPEKPGWVTRYDCWPPPASQWQTFYLTKQGEMTQTVPAHAHDGGQRCYCYPLGTEMCGSQRQFALEPDSIGSVSYRMPPRARDMVILGSAELTLYFSTSGSDVDFMFVLKDVDPEGNKLFLQKTVLRASKRAVDARASTEWECLQSFDRIEPLTPGHVYEVRLSLTAVGHVLRRGHSLEFTVLAPNTIPAPVWGFSACSESSLIALYHGERHPSRIRFPVLAGETARAAAPRPGALENQPYRTPDELANS